MGTYFQAVSPVEFALVLLWLVAGGISLYFSVGSSRIWTSLSTGFLLVFVSEAYQLYPVPSTTVTALHAVVGTVAILAITHGLQEYYVFSRTLEAGGDKKWVYLAVAGTLAASAAFILVNPTPTAFAVRNIQLVENGAWVFLTVINLDMLRKIYAQVKDSGIGPGFVALGVCFAALFLWRGSELYLQVYGWDSGWEQLGARHALPLDLADYPLRVGLARGVHAVGSVLASVTTGATFLYVARLLR